MVHLALNCNISSVVQNARRACSIPQLMHAKIKNILLTNSMRSGNYNNTVDAKKHAADLFVHYERVRSAMQSRCDFHLKLLVDHFEIWYYATGVFVIILTFILIQVL